MQSDMMGVHKKASFTKQHVHIDKFIHVLFYSVVLFYYSNQTYSEIGSTSKQSFRCEEKKHSKKTFVQIGYNFISIRQHMAVSCKIIRSMDACL